MIFTHMDQELWQYWLYTMNSLSPIEYSHLTKLKYPDHGFWREEGINLINSL
jgi:hypothetical protein